MFLDAIKSNKLHRTRLPQIDSSFDKKIFSVTFFLAIIFLGGKFFQIKIVFKHKNFCAQISQTNFYFHEKKISEKFFFQRKILFRRRKKNFGENFFLEKKFFLEKNFFGEKSFCEIFWQKNFSSEKNFFLRNFFFGPKNFY